jgi:hypothetical protein
MSVQEPDHATRTSTACAAMATAPEGIFNATVLRYDAPTDAALRQLTQLGCSFQS